MDLYFMRESGGNHRFEMSWPSKMREKQTEMQIEIEKAWRWDRCLQHQPVHCQKRADSLLDPWLGLARLTRRAGGSSPRSINPGWLIWGVPESPKTAQWFMNPGFTLSKTFKVFINWPSKGPVSSPVAAHLYIHSLPSIRERMQIMPLLRFTVPNFWQSTAVQYASCGRTCAEALKYLSNPFRPAYPLKRSVGDRWLTNRSSPSWLECSSDEESHQLPISRFHLGMAGKGWVLFAC